MLLRIATMTAVLLILAPLISNAEFVSPEVLNSHAIFSPACARIVYSSNKEGAVRPFVIDMTNPKRPKISDLRITGERSFIAESLAPDCRMLAMVSDHGGDRVFEVYLYDLERGRLQKLSTATGRDQGKPAFAPVGSLLAYLTDERLALYDYAHTKAVDVPATTLRFQSVAWADDGGSVFLEDERFDIWQYDIATAKLRRIWMDPKESFFPRAISEKRGRLLFSSDHQTRFRQIYSLDLNGGTPRRLYPTDHDQFSPIALGDDEYTFRSDIDASFIGYKLERGRCTAMSPSTGVAYDFSLGFGPPLLLYSNDQYPIGFFWFENGTLRPLLSTDPITHQVAIPIRNSSGMVNFLYLPSRPPRALVIWLHGGPHEQVSPRYNLYFDFFLHHDIAVYAINYPGSTGIGPEYAMLGMPQAEAVPRQIRAIEDDVRQLDRVRPIKAPRIIIGVSYGSILARRVAADDKEFTRLIDFSGVSDPDNASDSGPSVPSALFIYGDNDAYQKDPARIALIERYARNSKVTKLVLANEGHFIARRDSVDAILKAIDAFLKPLDHREAPPASHMQGKVQGSS